MSRVDARPFKGGEVIQIWSDSSGPQNWENPFNHAILNEDGSNVLIEPGGTFLWPKLQFPEAETGTVSIDMSFNSDVLLEDDNGAYGWGYLLHEESAGQGNGPQRYISLEEDTEGPDRQYESIPIVDTHVIETWYNSTRMHLIGEDGNTRFMFEDGDLITLDTIPVYSDSFFIKDIRRHISFFHPLMEDGSQILLQDSTNGTSDLLKLVGQTITQAAVTDLTIAPGGAYSGLGYPEIGVATAVVDSVFQYILLGETITEFVLNPGSIDGTFYVGHNITGTDNTNTDITLTGKIISIISKADTTSANLKKLVFVFLENMIIDIITPSKPP